MDTTVITAIAKEIVENQLLLNWKYYFFLSAIYCFCFVASNFISSYLNGRGSNLATKADFDEILKQLQKTTETTESIKQTISHEDWVMREYKIIRRSKLEELLYAIYDSRDWIEKLRQSYLFAEHDIDETSSPLKKVIVIGGLYFPELKNDIGAFSIKFLDYQSWLINCKAELVRYKPITSPSYIQALRPIADKNQDFYVPLIDAMANIETKANYIMNELLHESINK